VNRPEQPEPFLRGCAFSAAGDAAYPRARNDDRLPRDTWAMASIPVGVRLELVGDAAQVEIGYETATDDLGYRGDGAGRFFSLWRNGRLVGETPAVLGAGVATLDLSLGGEQRDAPAIVYLPEGMRPTITSVTAVGGTIEPAPPQPRWVAYGDSVAEGWVASAPALAWPAIAGREHGLDVVNMGYAGAARGEIVSAEHVAGLECDVITISHGTNCWTRVAHSTEMIAAGLSAFIRVVRTRHQATPIFFVSPVIRPDAEATPNVLGATLADLRFTMERVAADCGIGVIAGLDIVNPAQLADGIHPNDEGHRALAAAVAPIVAGAVAR
jgi:lysophospholipase L1-like esterase